jgi:multidrug efflux pump subunit AcrA (membrane-fusion protein)
MNAEAAPRAAARKRTTRWAIGVAVALVVVVGAVAAYTLLKSKSTTSTNVTTAVVKKQTLSVLVSGSGTSVVSDSVTVNPKISGTVKKLYVSLGETVTAGDRLYTITSDDVETSRLQSKASLLQSKQSLAQAEQSKTQASNQLYAANTALIEAEQNLDNLRSQPATTTDIDDKITLAKRQVTSAKKTVANAEDGVDTAAIGIDVAQANYTSSKQSYDDAVDAANDTVVEAPIDGVVTVLPISVGSDVNAGTTSSSSSGGTASTTSGTSSTSSSSGSGSSITVSDMGSLEVEVSVSEADIPSVAVDQTATVTFDALDDTEFVGTVKSISPNGTSSSGVVNFTVTLELDHQDGRLRPDMTATADIATQVAENVLTVPVAAVKSDNGSKYVVVMNGTQQVNTPVTVGVSDDSYTEIKSGVSEGAVVVTGSTTSTSSSSSSSSDTRGGGFMMGGPTGGGTPPAGAPGGN